MVQQTSLMSGAVQNLDTSFLIAAVPMFMHIVRLRSALCQSSFGPCQNLALAGFTCCKTINVTSRFVLTPLIGSCQNLVLQQIMRVDIYPAKESLESKVCIAINFSIHSNSLSQPPLPASTMNATNPSTQINLSVVDDDSKRLAIIYGTLGTMLAPASLAFAALTWARSRRHQCEVNSKTMATTDRALEENESGVDAREAYELEGSIVGDAPVDVSRSVISKFIDVDNCLLFSVSNTT